MKNLKFYQVLLICMLISLKSFATSDVDFFFEKLDAAFTYDGYTYFFKGSQVLKYNLSDRVIVDGYPKNISEAFSPIIPSIFTNGIDASFAFKNKGIAVFYKDKNYFAFKIESRGRNGEKKLKIIKKDSGQLDISWNKIKCAASYGDTGYLFQGDGKKKEHEYVRMTWSGSKVVKGTWDEIPKGWPSKSVWDDVKDSAVPNIFPKYKKMQTSSDAATNYKGSAFSFFAGEHYYRYVAGEGVSTSTPNKISEWGNFYSFHTKNWMSKLEPSTKLGEITFPGTHDSGTLDFGSVFEIGGKWSHTQNTSINDQLYGGIRYLDIRLRAKTSVNPKSLYTAHGISISDKSWDSINKDVCNFLKKNSNETVIVRVQIEPNPNPVAFDVNKATKNNFNDILKKRIKGYEKYWYGMNGETLNNMSDLPLHKLRGKAVMIYHNYIADKNEFKGAYSYNTAAYGDFKRVGSNVLEDDFWDCTSKGKHYKTIKSSYIVPGKFGHVRYEEIDRNKMGKEYQIIDQWTDINGKLQHKYKEVKAGQGQFYLRHIYDYKPTDGKIRIIPCSNNYASKDWKVALPGTSYIGVDHATCYPLNYANQFNPQLLKDIKNGRVPNREDGYGIFALDFPFSDFSGDLVREIIDLNSDKFVKR